MRDGAQQGALDLDLLARQTLGDRELEAELFVLFEAQLDRLMSVVAGDGDRTTRAEAAHSLKGASSAIGAAEVMRLAGELELAFGTDGPEPASLLSGLVAAVADARVAIASWAQDA
jgi:HPt (histidine-containing phosphotransfer) domain-containing protein